jgi:putative transposase
MRLAEQVKLLSRRVGVLEAEAEIARRLAGFDQRGAERQRLYRFIEAEAANFTLTMLCRVCRVSRSAYYSWRAGGDGADQATWDEALVVDAIFDIWSGSRRRYGSPRVSAALAKQGWKVNEKRVARLMGELAIAGKHGRRKLVTTQRDKDATPAPDLVERDFSAEAPDELWVGDITYSAQFTVMCSLALDAP